MENNHVPGYSLVMFTGDSGNQYTKSPKPNQKSLCPPVQLSPPLAASCYTLTRPHHLSLPELALHQVSSLTQQKKVSAK